MLLDGTILIADEQSLCREGLISLLRRSGGQEPVVQVDRFEGVLGALANNQAIASLIIDLNLPGLRGSSGIRLVRSHYLDLGILVTAASFDRASVLECLNAGAHGCIAKSLCCTEITDALRTIGNGKIYAPASFRDEIGHEPAPKAPIPLSNRQREVLEQLAAGKSNKEIARKLGIAEGTVKIHLNAVFRTLGVRNRVGAAAAFRNAESGVVPSEPVLPGLVQNAWRSAPSRRSIN